MKTEIKYGLITGAGVCLWVMTVYFLGFHTAPEKMHIGEYSGFFSYIIPIVCLYLGIKNKRDKELGGYIRFGQGLTTGFLMTLITALITVIFFFIYNKFINTDWMEIGIEYTRKKLVVEGLNPAEISLRIENMRKMYTLKMQLTGAFIGTIIQGMILSVVISFILRKENKSIAS